MMGLLIIPVDIAKKTERVRDAVGAVFAASWWKPHLAKGVGEGP